MVKKQCEYSLCWNRENYFKPRPNSAHVRYFPFPRPKTDFERCLKWISACGRFDNRITIEKIKKSTYYICSDHFVGGHGPTESNPDPIQFEETQETLRLMHQNENNSLSLNTQHPQDKVPVIEKPEDSQYTILEEIPDANDTQKILSSSENPIKLLENSTTNLIPVPQKAKLTHFEPCHVNDTQMNVMEEDSKFSQENQSDENSKTILYSLLSKTVTPPSLSVNLATFGNETNQAEVNINNGIMYTEHLRQTFGGNPICSGWVASSSSNDDSVVFVKLDPGNRYAIKTFTIKNQDKRGTLKIHGKDVSNIPFIRDSLHDIQSVVSLRILIEVIDSFDLCSGIFDSKIVDLFDSKVKMKGIKNVFTNAIHANDCQIVLQKVLQNNGKSLDTRELCQNCLKYRRSLKKCMERCNKKNGENRNSYLPRAQLEKKMKQQAIANSQMRRKMKIMKTRMESHLKKFGEKLEPEDTQFFTNILDQQKKMLPKNSFQRLFIEQQLSVLKAKNKRMRRWHPKILQWCIHFYRKSPASYKLIASCGVLQLPSKRTLYNHSSHIGLTPAFNNFSFQKAKDKLYQSCPEEHQRYVSLILDEMKIKEDIIYKANTGELVGFTNLDDVGNEILRLRQAGDDEMPEVATHVLQLMIRSVTGNFKFPLAYFPCKNVDSDNLTTIVSEAISRLEYYGIKVVAVIADGASTNRKAFRNFVKDGFKWKNIFASDEERFVFFICDPPHLIKTTRNGFANSNFHTKTKRLFKNGQEILWTHVLKLFEMDSQRPLRLVPKLTRDHLFLDSYSRMRVRLAAQILSATVANALEFELGEGVRETVQFIRIMNQFFDLMNTKNLDEGKFKRNPNLNPFKIQSDPRLEWLEQTFIKYFEDWQNEVSTKAVNLKAAERLRMTLSRETVEGLIMTARSVPGVVRFLLSKGASFVLTFHLNQDCLEQEFGKQRASCGGNTNPDVLHFGQNVDRFISLEKEILAPFEGNTSIIPENN